MARDLFILEKGIGITDVNADTRRDILTEAGAPGSSTATDNAAVGSLYLQSDSGGALYRKKTAGSGTDKWVRMLTNDDLLGISFRSELVRAATGDAAPAFPASIDLVVNPFGDDQAPTMVAADFAIGEYIIFGVGGTPVLAEVTNVSGDSITVAAATDVLANSDKFVVRNYLPDSPDSQEDQALVEYYNGVIYKLGDVNWNFADGIGLAAAYAAANGSITSADTVNSAIEKLDGNQQDLITLSGVAQGATELGSFTGTIIPDSQTVKAALQALETDLEALQTLTGVAAESVNLGTFTGTIIPDSSTIKAALQSLETDVEAIQTALGIAAEAVDFGTFTGSVIPDSSTAKAALQALETYVDGAVLIFTSQAAVTTAVTLDEVLVDSVKGVVWEIVLSLDSDPARVVMMTVSAVHDGVVAPGTPADAANVDDAAYAKLKVGASFDYSVSVDLNGTGASQTMRLRVSASAAITAKATRIVVKN